jgi:hypothetical protein
MTNIKDGLPADTTNYFLAVADEAHINAFFGVPEKQRSFVYVSLC